MTSIKKGSFNATLRRASFSAPYRYIGTDAPTPSGIQWQGDDTFVLEQTGTIDYFNPGTVGTIHLLEKVYQKGTTTEFCVSAESGDELGIDYVDIYYGGAKPTRQTTIEKRNGVQGYWFDLQHDDVAEIVERTIYAKIVPKNAKGLIHKVVSKTIRVGQLTTISLGPSDCLSSTTHLHRRMRWDYEPSGAGTTTNGVIYELDSGIYYWLDDSLPSSEPATDPWVEVRAAAGADVEIRIMSVGSIPDATRVANFNRSSRSVFRLKHANFVGVTLNLNERTQIYGSGIYVGFDDCTIIDPPMNLYTTPAGSIARAREFDGTGTENFFAQEFLKADEGGPWGNRVEVHNSRFNASVAGGCTEYFNTEFSCSFDVFYFNRAADGLVIKSCTQQVPYGTNTPDITALRYLTAVTGVRTATWSGPGSTGDYIYLWDDVRDISKMVYEITAIDTASDTTEYTITLDATPTNYPTRFTPGSGFTTSTKFFDWSLFKWDSGLALTRGNRKFIDKPVNDTTLVMSWTTADDATGVLSNVIRLYRTNGNDVETGGFAFADLDLSVGDRISVNLWNHADFLQTSGTASALRSVLVQDTVSVFEQQALFQSPAEVFDFVVSNSMLIDPSGSASVYQFKFERPEKLRATFKNASLVHNDLVFRTDVLDANEFDVKLYGSIFRSIVGLGGSASWPLTVKDCVHEGISNMGSGAGTTETNNSTWSGSLGIDAYGVPTTSGNADWDTSISSPPYGIDGAQRSGSSWQVGAHSASGVSFIPRISDYFIGYPDPSEMSPTAGTTVSVVDGEIETDKVSPSITYQWYTESGAISGATSQSFDTTGRTGDRLWCLVTHGDAAHWVDFGVVQ